MRLIEREINMHIYFFLNDSLVLNCIILEKKLIEPWNTASWNLAEISIYSPKLAPSLKGVIARNKSRLLKIHFAYN